MVRADSQFDYNGRANDYPKAFRFDSSLRFAPRLTVPDLYGELQIVYARCNQLVAGVNRAPGNLTRPLLGRLTPRCTNATAATRAKDPTDAQ